MDVEFWRYHHHRLDRELGVFIADHGGRRSQLFPGKSW
jgi:hypothetical protein